MHFIPHIPVSKGRLPDVGHVQPALCTKEIPVGPDEMPFAALAGRRYFMYRSTESRACVWDLERRVEHGQMEGKQGSGLFTVSSSHCGSFAACLSLAENASAVNLWELDPFRCAAEVVRPHDDDGNRVLSVCLLEGGKALLGTTQGNLEAWDLSQGQGAAGTAGAPTAVLSDPHTGPILGIKSASSAPSLVLSGSTGGSLKLWDLRTNSCVRTIAAEEWVCFMDLDADAKVAICNSKNTARLWDLGSGRCIGDVILGPGSKMSPRVAMHQGGEAFLCCDGSFMTAWRTSDLSQPFMKAQVGPEGSQWSSCRLAANSDLSRIGISCHLEDEGSPALNKIMAWV